MSGLSSNLNYYRAAGSFPRSVSDRNLPFYLSTGNVIISGSEPDLLWVQSSLTPMSGSIFRLWNIQMVASTNIVDVNEAIEVIVDIGFPITFKEGVPLTGNFSIASSPNLYNAYKYWRVNVVGNTVVFSVMPSSLSLGTQYVQFFLNFFLFTNVL